MAPFSGTTAVSGNDAAADLTAIGLVGVGFLPNGGQGAFQGGAKLGMNSAAMVLGPLRVCDLIVLLPNQKGVGKNLVYLDITREVARFFSGVISTLSTIMMIVIDAIKTIGPMIIEAAKHIKTTASGVACLLYALTAIPKVIKAVHCLTILNKLEKNLTTLDKIYAENPNELKVAAPEIYARLQKNEAIDPSLINQAMKECKENGILSIVTVCLSVIAIVATILVAVFTGGIGLVIGAVIGAVVLLTITAVDIKSWISALKDAKGLNDKELAVNIVSIVIGIVSLVVAVFFAPTLLLQVIGGLLCAIPIAIPIFNLIYLKVKESQKKLNND